MTRDGLVGVHGHGFGGFALSSEVGDGHDGHDVVAAPLPSVVARLRARGWAAKNQGTPVG